MMNRGLMKESSIVQKIITKGQFQEKCVADLENKQTKQVHEDRRQERAM